MMTSWWQLSRPQLSLWFLISGGLGGTSCSISLDLDKLSNYSQLRNVSTVLKVCVITPMMNACQQKSYQLLFNKWMWDVFWDISGTRGLFLFPSPTLTPLCSSAPLPLSLSAPLPLPLLCFWGTAPITAEALPLDPGLRVGDTFSSKS